MAQRMNRRAFMQLAAGGTIAMAAANQTSAAAWQEGAGPWPLCLNTSTIRPAPFLEKIHIAAETGYDAIELWINELEEYEEKGGDLKDLSKKIRDRGLFVPNVIGLWNCMPATDEQFQESLQTTRTRMRIASAVGSQHVAAIPAPDRPDFNLKWGAQAYRKLIEIGRVEFNIKVAFEFVGFLEGVHRLGQAGAVALDANDPDACLVADTFHLFRGGSGFEGIRHLDGGFIAVFHFNDAPANPPREQQADRDRIYPGDGVLPLKRLLQHLKEIDYRGALSLEMFNRDHWEQDPKVVAATGLQKMRELINSALT